MPRDAGATRTALLDSAEGLILDHGFSATSVDKVIERAGVTKGTFFYHFKTKADLARALVERYQRLDLARLEANLGRAEQLSRDPLQQILIFIGLYKEEAEALTEPYPGCLFASYCYEAELFDAATLNVVADTMSRWRARLGAKFADVIAARPPQLPADPEALADMITVVFEGSFIVSKVLNEPKVVAAQLGLYRDYIELLFTPDP